MWSGLCGSTNTAVNGWSELVREKIISTDEFVPPDRNPREQVRSYRLVLITLVDKLGHVPVKPDSQ